MSNHIKSTADHAEHQSLLDTVGYDIGKSVDMTLRDTESIGIDTVGDKTYLTAYSHKNDKHYRIKGHEYSNESDARDVIAAHNASVRQHVVEENRPPASKVELDRRAAQRERHKRENAEGHSWSPN